MSFFPHSRIFVGPSKTVDIVGSHIQVLDNLTGNVLSSSANFSDEHKERVLKSGPIRCAAVDRELKYLITSGEDKILKLWEIDGLKLLNERELPKKPTAVAFTANAETIVVSDKFGDIFCYPFTYTPPTADELKSKEKERSRDALSSHENPSGGQLILGHASPLNAFTLTSDEKFIITADRDEHIRVSWYPKGYNIEMYCLGHLKFVSAIHIPKSDPSTLISGGGDPVLKIWDWMTGALKHELPVLEVIEPFIAVRASKRKRGFGFVDDDDDDAPEASSNKGKGRRKKGKKGVPAEEAAGEEAATPGSEGDEKKEEEPKLEKVLVMHHVESVETDSGLHVVFSAVGTTALFSFPYKGDVAPSDIRFFDCGKPVLDFSIGDDSRVIVQLDGAWVSEASAATNVTTETGNNTTLSPMVKVLKFSGGELREDPETLKSLVDALNSTALLPATGESLKRLALYSDLISMPKYADPEDDAAEGGPVMPVGAPEISASETAKAKGKAKAELSKKELGRIKTKQAVLAKAMEIEGGDGKEGARKLEELGQDEDGPETKRARSDVDVASGGDGDVQMTDG